MASTNGTRIWGLRRVDIAAIVGLSLVVYGMYTGRIEWAMLGIGVSGISVATRIDKP
jgi:hypothetical protein